jgi:hypothetical protein
MHFSAQNLTDTEQEYGISPADFMALNTYVNSSCGGLWPSYSYCVSGVPLGSGASSTETTPTSTATPVTTPSPVQTGIVAGCILFYKTRAGDGCYDIAAEFGVTLNEFYELNPAVGENCGSLWPNYYYCVGMWMWFRAFIKVYQISLGSPSF